MEKNMILLVDLLEKLKQLHYPTTYTTIARYQRQGIFMLPDKSNPKGAAGLRSYFSPLAIVEIIVNYHFLKSEVPVKLITDSDSGDGKIFEAVNFERMSPPQIYIARLGYYHSYFDFLNKWLISAGSSPLSKVLTMDLTAGKEVFMDSDALQSAYRDAVSTRLKSIQGVLPSDVVPRYEFPKMPPVSHYVEGYCGYLSYVYGTAYKTVLASIAENIGL
jgi:hypothetical protein